MIDLMALVVACAPFVDPYTMRAVVMVESRGNPWAINVNKSSVKVAPVSYEDAVLQANRLLAQGKSIDMGLTQVNSKTMRNLGLTVEQVFDPCTNLYTGGTVLWRFFIRAEKKFGRTQASLLAALSGYNTGNFEDGFSNGYVQRVLRAAQ